ncbi:MAG: PQQ-dependent sugar dehydrogenase [Arenicellales bacterium]
MRRLFIILLGCLFTGLSPNSVFAFPSLLTQWQAEYPHSNSDAEANCQLCHQRTDGGNGWNDYGWDIRLAYIASNRNNFRSTLRSINETDSDTDLKGLTNIAEIIGHGQPGWKAGANNTIHCYVPSGSNCDGNAELLSHAPPNFSALNAQLIPQSIPLGMQLKLQTIATGFTAPNLAIPAPGINDSVFVLDQPGYVWQVNVDTGQKHRVLDLSPSGRDEIVSDLAAVFPNLNFDERGLLGLAFHPQFQSNGLFYTYQSEDVAGSADFTTLSGAETANHQSVIAEWQAVMPLKNPLQITGTKRVLMRVDQPQFNHNGGMIAFGPDGYLYISLGDGGNRDDKGVGHGVSGNGQDLSNPLGAILRIDPTHASGVLSVNGQYGIPVTNPFVGQAAKLDEIYAYGLRNTFRFSFDDLTGDLYAGDVGQDDIEEVNQIIAGHNYGWNQKEGRFYFYANGNESGYASNIEPDPAPVGLSDPIMQYDHDEGLSVIGGYIYRGSNKPALNGAYIFGDWSKKFDSPQGRLFYSLDKQNFFEFDTGEELNMFVNGFGYDTFGEHYVVGNTTGTPTGNTGVLRKFVVATDDDTLCFPVKTQQGKVVLICL